MAVAVESWLPQSTKEDILSFVTPKLSSPYPIKKNPYEDAAKMEAFAWMRENGLEGMYKDPKVLLGAIEGDIAGLSMQTFVNTTKEMAPWVCEFYLWTFALDDFLDDADYFRFPEKTIAMFVELNLYMMWSFPDEPKLRQNFIEMISYQTTDLKTLDATLEYVDDKLAEARLLAGTIYKSSTMDTEPLVKALPLLWKDLLASSHSQYAVRWAIAFQEFAIANMMEVKNRSSNTIPSLAEYIHLRRGTGGTYLCAMIYELSDQAFISEDVFCGKDFQDFHLAFADMIGWMNDIFSFKKEAMLGEIHNLVCILKNEKGCSYQEAGEEAFQMLLNRIEDMDKASKVLMETTPKESLPGVEAYIKGSQNWLSGGYSWHVNSTRYNKVKA